MLKRIFVITIILLLGIIVAGCSNMGTGDGTGELAFYLADAPVNDIEEVNVVFDEIRVHSEESGWITVEDFAGEGGSREVNLLELRLKEELLGQVTLEDGIYDQIRLILEAAEAVEGYESSQSYVVVNGEQKELFIPSGEQTGLKIKQEFSVAGDTITEVTLDTDVREIMKEMPGASVGFDYILRPTAFNVIENHRKGAVTGKVVAGEGISSEELSTLLTDSNYNVTVTAENSYVNNEDLSQDKNVSTVADMNGQFKLRGLEPGTERLTVTVVNAGNGEKISGYEGTKEVEIEAGKTTEGVEIELNKN